MKNTTNLDSDGSRWSMLHNGPATNKYRLWGARFVFPVPSGITNGRGNGISMILLEGGWHYAHSDDVSDYCAPKAFEAPNGLAAWWIHESDVAADKIKSAQKSLEDAHEHFKAMQNNLAETLSAPVS